VIGLPPEPIPDDVDAFRRVARAFLSETLSGSIDEWERGDAPVPFRQLFRRIGERGFFSAAYPVSAGGSGKGTAHRMVWLEELGRLDSSGLALSLATQSDMSTPPLLGHGSPRLKQEILVKALAGELIGAVAITERSGGSDLSRLATTIEPAGAGYAVTGSKAFVTNAGIADFFVTLCRIAGTSRRLCLAVVTAETPGVSVARPYRKLGNRAGDHAEVTFDGAVVAEDMVLGLDGSGLAIQLEQLAHERFALAVIFVAQARRMIEGLMPEARSRVVFGRPLVDHQRVSFSLVDLYSEVLVLESYVMAVASLLDRDRDCVAEASVAKVRAARLVKAVADECLELSGARGFMLDESLARSVRDARGASLVGGAEDAIMHMLVGLLPR